MKFFSACVLLTVSLFLCAADPYGYDGKPGCKTLPELGQLFRNFWDPTKYWRCVALNEAAVSERCEDGSAFQQSAGGCVPWIDWVWEPTEMPPSRPDGSATQLTDQASTAGIPNLPNQ